MALLSTAANLFNAWLKRSCLCYCIASLLRSRIQKMTQCACCRKRVKRASNILVLLCREFGHWNPRGRTVLHGVPRSHFENRCCTKVFTRVIVLYGALINDKLTGGLQRVCAGAEGWEKLWKSRALLFDCVLRCKLNVVFKMGEGSEPQITSFHTRGVFKQRFISELGIKANCPLKSLIISITG